MIDFNLDLNINSLKVPKELSKLIAWDGATSFVFSRNIYDKVGIIKVFFKLNANNFESQDYEIDIVCKATYKDVGEIKFNDTLLIFHQAYIIINNIINMEFVKNNSQLKYSSFMYGEDQLIDFRKHFDSIYKI